MIIDIIKLQNKKLNDISNDIKILSERKNEIVGLWD